MEKTEEQLEMTLDELGKVTTINSAMREQLHNEKDRSSHVEEQFRVGIMILVTWPKMMQFDWLMKCKDIVIMTL